MNIFKLVGKVVLGGFIGGAFIYALFRYALMKIRGGRKKGQEALPVRPSETVDDSEKKLNRLREKLLQTEKELWKIQILKPYEKLFEKIVVPVQTLLGLANVPLDSLAKDMVDYYMWNVITDSLTAVVKNADETLTDPEPDETFAEDEIKDRINNMDTQKIKKNIQENEARIHSAKIAVQKAHVIKGLGSIVEELQELDRSEPVMETDVCQIANKAQSLLEKMGFIQCRQGMKD